MKEAKELTEILRVVAGQAALATKEFIGSGEKEAGDQAAVDAMRRAFDGARLDAIVRVGEGEKDEAPMLYVGETLGTGKGVAVDIAVDPVEGTRLMAEGLPNAITVIAATQRGRFWDSGSAYYMDKLVVGAEAKGAIDINRTPMENIKAIAKALDKPVTEVGVYILDKPRHHALIEELKAAGVLVYIHKEGDVIGSVLALMPDTGIDVLMGIGGAPEAVITAAAVRALGGDMQGKLAPQKAEEELSLEREGIDLSRVYQVDDLVLCDWAIFAAAGVTSGPLLAGVQTSEVGDLTTECITIGPDLGQVTRSTYNNQV
ncbi:fructose-1,6-bisphosphatase II [Reichenbachiella agariperforans]|uniref:Fructose-1,6-bisphosphatase n=1 Tax=Reichenbachiella agariperforans TaxID=156994 RepID=A0A1M6N512_REIAG|nr:class II fructose-bisphosphatase [Reichenbachiella agariperforans]SHJ90835.1 fructose-1,6-bisphosphatase II [Reichenbachiella agariperforans]